MNHTISSKHSLCPFASYGFENELSIGESVDKKRNRAAIMDHELEAACSRPESHRQKEPESQMILEL